MEQNLLGTVKQSLEGLAITTTWIQATLETLQILFHSSLLSHRGILIRVATALIFEIG